MKPLGTITMCFPHVDNETRSIFQSVMDKAENYSDFVVRLCDIACSETSSSMVRYFAFFHAFHIDMYPQMKRLVNTDETPLYYEPLHLVSQINTALFLAAAPADGGRPSAGSAPGSSAREVHGTTRPTCEPRRDR